MLRWIGTLEIFFLTAQFIEIMIAYHWRTNGYWRHNSGGRVLMVIFAAFALVMANSSAALILAEFGVLPPRPISRDPGWWQAVRLIIFAVVPAAVLYMRIAMQRWTGPRGQHGDTLA